MKPCRRPTRRAGEFYRNQAQYKVLCFLCLMQVLAFDNVVLLFLGRMLELALQYNKTQRSLTFKSILNYAPAALYRTLRGVRSISIAKVFLSTTEEANEYSNGLSSSPSHSKARWKEIPSSIRPTRKTEVKEHSAILLEVGFTI